MKISFAAIVIPVCLIAWSSTCFSQERERAIERELAQEMEQLQGSLAEMEAWAKEVKALLNQDDIGSEKRRELEEKFEHVKIRMAETEQVLKEVQKKRADVQVQIQQIYEREQRHRDDDDRRHSHDDFRAYDEEHTHRHEHEEHERHAHGEEMHPEILAAMRQLEHLHVAHEHLREAGRNDLAERVAHEAEVLAERIEAAKRRWIESREREARELEQREPRRPRSGEGFPIREFEERMHEAMKDVHEGFMEMKEEIEELREQVRDLRREIDRR